MIYNMTLCRDLLQEMEVRKLSCTVDPPSLAQTYTHLRYHIRQKGVCPKEPKCPKGPEALGKRYSGVV